MKSPTPDKSELTIVIRTAGGTVVSQKTVTSPSSVNREALLNARR